MKNIIYLGAYMCPIIVFSSFTFAVQLPASLSDRASSQNRDLANFDITTLKNRGISPEVAEYFAHGARFSPGMQKVSLTLNGDEKGEISLYFNESGEPCFDEEFNEFVGLKTPGNVIANTNKDNANARICYDYGAAWPGSVIKLNPGQEQIALIVPNEALDNRIRPRNYQTGGTAALLNYNMFTSQSRYSGGNSDYNQGTFEAGFNVAD